MRPVCQNCSRTWTWWDVAKHSFSIRKYIVCPYCRVKQYATKASIRFEFVVCYSIFFVFLTTYIRTDSLTPPIAVFLILFGCYQTIYPFFHRVSNTKEGLFQSFRPQ
ncbi:TIGR04104 family putative zinc finger protein [Sinobaca sp. H24]|uniref:TIGR04104 family putative zinc finger protein n=1 Tax=Sinobaca sp. H24 TaxID=2923376 RepID=UPI0035B127E9